MARAEGRQRLGVLERALKLSAAGSAGTKSESEDAFLHLLQSAGETEPLVNTELLGEEVDFHWPDRRLVVEVDGDGHERPRTQRNDARRDAMLSGAGRLVLRFTGDEVEQRPRQVLDRLRAA